jgi:hypothetical protein
VVDVNRRPTCSRRKIGNVKVDGFVRVRLSLVRWVSKLFFQTFNGFDKRFTRREIKNREKPKLFWSGAEEVWELAVAGS